jgi:hypothetical protein
MKAANVRTLYTGAGFQPRPTQVSLGRHGGTVKYALVKGD